MEGKTVIAARRAENVDEWTKAITDRNSTAGFDEMGLALLLRRWMGWKTGGGCEPTRSRLAEHACVSEPTIGRRIAKMQEAGWLRVTFRGRKGSGRPSLYEPMIPVDYVPWEEARRADRGAVSVGAQRSRASEREMVTPVAATVASSTEKPKSLRARALAWSEETAGRYADVRRFRTELLESWSDLSRFPELADDCEAAYLAAGRRDTPASARQVA